MSTANTLKERAKRAVGWPLRRVLDPRLDGLLNEITHRQDLSASATQESMEALAVGTRLLRGSVLDLADELHGSHRGRADAGELELLRAAALGAVAASGAQRAVLVAGEDMSEHLAALGIAQADAAGADAVGLMLVVALDLPAAVPVDRLAPGGRLILAHGRDVDPDLIAALTAGLEVEASAAIAPLGPAGLGAEPGDPAPAGVSRLVVARRPR